VARTIADLRGYEGPLHDEHVLQALAMRSSLRTSDGMVAGV
jgi:hypothetical protein